MRRQRNESICILLVLLALSGACMGPRRSAILPASVPGKPYIQNYKRIGNIAVWIVNGQYIRERLDEEFTNFGQHYRFRFIPINEFWLDQEYTPGEEQFFIDHLLVEHRFMAGGMDYDSALDKADAAEKAERAQTALFQQGDVQLKSGHAVDLLRRIHKELLSEYSTDIKVWVVDGEIVRDQFLIDFTEGGHDKVYKFIPSNEIWIDDDVMPGERKFILLHEMHERRLMEQGWSYNRAHRDASTLEFRCRRNPQELEIRLREEINRSTAGDTR